MTTTPKMDAAVDLAEAQAGYAEGRCSATVGNNTRFGAWYGMNCAAWCAMFVSWSYFTAGFPQPASTPKGFAYTPSGAAWYQARRAWAGPGTNPQRGWVVFFYSASAGRIAHVGLVRGPRGSDGMVPTVEGNTNVAGGAEGGGVYLKRRSPSQSLSFRVAGYGRPELLEGADTQEEEWWMAEIPASELQKIQVQATQALQSSPGQEAQIKATIAGVEQAISGIGSNQVFVRQIDTPQVYMVTALGLLHVPSFTVFKLYGGDNPSAKTIMLPKDSPIWTDHPIYGQQPGDTA
jgi:CHAP domain